MTIKPIVAAALAGLLGACASQSLQDLQADVNRRVQVGMPLSTAMRNLERAGFSCDSGNRTAMDTGEVCARDRNHRLLAMCIQRVQLDHDAGFVTRIAVPEPACAGL